MSTGRKRKKQLPAIVVLLIAAAVCAVAFLNGNSESEKPISKPDSSSDKLVVHFLDVGQGDSEFIELPNGKCMLIDAGTAEYSQTIIDDIENYGYNAIDYVVATHPHADHIGGMREVIESFEVSEIYMPKVSAATKTFERLLDTVSDKNMSINTAKAGVEVYSDSTLKIEFLAPIGAGYEELNNYSAVVKISYGRNSFLFTGDAEALAEKEMLENSYAFLNADVLKTGHHGSNSSSTASFLNAVKPKYAVISCGAGNSYGHPHTETIEDLSDIGAQIYRTDEQGTITITCDGNNNFTVETEGK